MKNVFVSLLVIGTLSSSCIAQDNIAFFQVEMENYVQFENYHPNVSLEFYSTPAGGKHIGNIKIGPTGEALQKFSFEQTPAFVLNRKGIENINGTNKVQQLNKKIFVAQDITFEISGSQTKLKWDAKIYEGLNINFKVLKKEENGGYTTMKIFKGNAGSNFCNYEFSETNSENASYIFQIVEDDNKIRYSRQMNSSAQLAESVSVFPTVCNSNLNIVFAKSIVISEYAVTDISGKVILRGKLDNLCNVISLASLNSGNYFLNVWQGDTKQIFKIIKI